MNTGMSEKVDSFEAEFRRAVEEEERGQSSLDTKLIGKAIALLKARSQAHLLPPQPHPEAPVANEIRAPRPKTTRSFGYRGFQFVVSFSDDLAAVSLIDPKTKNPSPPVKVKRDSYMRAVQSLARVAVAKQEMQALSSAAKH